MLCSPQDVNTNNSFPVQFALFRSFWYIFSTDTDATPSPNKFSIVHSQNKSRISQQKPSIGPHWIHFKLVKSVFFAAFVRLECSPRNMHQITRTNSFSQFLFSSKIKRQKDAISPNGVSCAHAQGVTWHIWAGEGQRLWKLRQILHPAVELDDIPADHLHHQKMLSIFTCTFSPYTFLYYIDLSTFVIETKNQTSWNTLNRLR